MMMHDLGMPAGQQAEGSASTNDINRLPEAVKHEDRLV